MWIEYFSYIVTFILSAGMSVIGILISYQLYQSYKTPVFAILLYQQIFLFSFFIYGIWGNMALREIISDLNLSAELAGKLAIFIPVIGIPFMVVSWFMLLKFSFNLNGYKFSKVFVYSYFPTFIVLIFVLTLLVQKEILQIPEKPNVFIVRIILLLNMGAHLVFLLPFLKPKQSAPLLKETGFDKKLAFVYLTGILFYSASMWFFNLFGFISTCFSIVLLFAISVFIPVKIRLNSMTKEIPEVGKNMDFGTFCEFYEITKREAEIVLEICSGKTNKAISEKLFITLQTVKDHTHHIYTKTGLNSRVQLSNLVREKTGELNIEG
ncbi:MAG: helix-turn-helix transcriptional regulator [Prolixibacteraceae bacterium]|jgi:DNA-binding CsgD family transcriptional regulator|nr:helix-turn-helix transcriptional regulator [Prolixibacteraceae bacterium]MBT7000709.1 helix-turn-helix transcriptional regulator [Prolixibacteraceae bacterium]MBT7395297.1 helix-turn-helix transcriptional regulator [Prolixibacteraceae bacterium]